MAVLCSEIWLLIGVVFVLHFPVIRSELCHKMWTFHAPTRSCMVLIEYYYNYLEASQYCEADFTHGSGHLVFIFDKATDDFVKGLLNEGYVDSALIGLNDRANNGDYLWGERTPIPANYTGWADNPHIPDYSKQAVIITKDGWQEYDSSLKDNFVCQISVGPNVGFEMKIIPEQTQQMYSIGVTSAITCIASVAENNQRPSLHWEIRGVQVTATDKTARIRIVEEHDGSLMLLVNNVQDGDEGTYKCVAMLGSQSDSRSLTFVVMHDLAVLSPASQYGIFGTDGVVKCEAVAKPASSTTWKFENGTTIHSGTKYIIHKDQMIIKDLNEDDSATYVCDIVVIETGERQHFHIDYQVVQNLKVLSPTSQYGIFGTDGSVKCEAVAKPAPSRTWRFYNGTNIQSGTKYIIQQDQMIIKDLNEGDTAKYVCDIVVIETGASKELDVDYQVVHPVMPDSKNGGSQAHYVGAIVGVIVAAMFAIIIFGVIIFLLRKKGAPCTRKKDQHANTPMFAVFKNDKAGSRHVVEELTEANALANQQ